MNRFVKLTPLVLLTLSSYSSVITFAQKPIINHSLPYDYEESKVLSYELHQNESNLNDINSFEAKHNLTDKLLELRSIQFLEIESHNHTLNSTYLYQTEKANYFFDNHNYTKAAELYKNIDLSSLDDETKFKKGYSLFVQQNYNDALQAFSQITQQSDYYDAATYYHGMSAYNLGDLNTARGKLKSVSAKHPYNKHTPYYLAQIYKSQNDVTSTIELSNKILSDDSSVNKLEIKKILAEAYYAEKKYAKVISTLSDVDNFNNNDYYILAESNYNLGYTNEALKYYDILATSNSPFQQSSKYKLAKIYTEQGKLDQAKGILTLLCDAKDNNIAEAAKLNVAEISYKTQDYNSALRYAEMLKSTQYAAKGESIINASLTASDDIYASIRYLENTSPRSQQLEETYTQLLLRQMNDYGVAEQHTELQHCIDKLSNRNLTPQEKSDVNFWKSCLAFNQKDYNQVIKLNNTINNQAIYQLGYSYYAEGKYTKAANWLEQYNANTEQQRIQKLEILAECYARNNNLAKARTNYEKAAKYGDIYAIRQLADIAQADGDVNTRIYLLQSLTEDTSISDLERRRLYFKLGEIHQQINNSPKAIEYYTLSTSDTNQQEPMTNDAYLRMGLLYYQNGQSNEAEEAYKLVAKYGPDEQKVLAINALRNIIVREQGKTSEFIEYVNNETNVKLDELTQDSLFYSVGNGYYTNGKYDETIKQHKQYLSKYPNGTYAKAATSQLAYAYLYSRDYDNAVKTYEQVLETDSQNYDARYKTAVIYLNHRNDYNKALNHYSQLFKNPPLPKEDKNAIIDGAFYSAIKQQSDSVTVLANMIINDNERTPKDKAKAYYHRGKLEYKKGQLDDAIKTFTEVKRLNNANLGHEANYWIAAAFYQKGDLERAEKIALETTKKSTAYPRWVAKSLLLLTDVFIDKEQIANAQASMKALENYKGNDNDILTEISEHKTLIDALVRKRQVATDTTSNSSIQINQPQNN